MKEYIKEIEEIAARCTMSQSDGYSQIIRICEAIKEIDNCMIHLSERLQLVENGYNKALNDFVEACSNQSTTMYGQKYVDMRDVKEIAEQLKFRRSTNE